MSEPTLGGEKSQGAEREERESAPGPSLLEGKVGSKGSKPVPWGAEGGGRATTPFNCLSKMNLWRGADCWVSVLGVKERRFMTRKIRSKGGGGQRWGFWPPLTPSLTSQAPPALPPTPTPELPCGPWPQ